ncbi:MAG: Ig-like domain-containing protein, partial [Candidatus Woesearchaeota archaeon]
GLKPGRHDYINIVIKDKLSKTAAPRELQGQSGYKTYLCIVSSTNPCNTAAQFTISTNATQLIINDLDLQDDQQRIGKLSPGANILKYYSVDKYRNIEVIGKSITILACDKCAGPKALDIRVAGATKINGRYYTNSRLPIITVVFNEPAQITAASFSKESTAIPFTASPASGFNSRYVFNINTPLSDGTYVFSLNAVDNNSVQMDDPVLIEIVIDTTPPTVAIYPPDKTNYETGTVVIGLNFSEPVLLAGTTLDEIMFVNKVVKKAFPIELASKLRTSDNMSFSGTISNLREGLKRISVRATDYASNPIFANSTFSIITAAPKIMIKQPSWGIASAYTFDLVFETSSAATCRYIYDVPTPPPEDQFDTLAEFDSTGGIEHRLSGFNRIPFGDTTKHNIHVYCKTEKFGTTKESFELYVDTVAPLIVSAYATPNPIAEPVSPNASSYATSLQVQTNKEGFCKYSATKQSFSEMEGYFPGFDEEPKLSHSTEITVTQATNHTYFIACKSLAGLPSPTVPVKFYVNTQISFAVNNTTPKYTKDGLFFLRVDSNKKSFCYFGEDQQAITNCFGNCSFTRGHVQQVMKPAGTYTFYVKCNTGAGGEISSVIPITVIVDSTPPVMLWVNDSTTLPGEPDISWYPDKLRVSFLGYDNETKVAKYYYMLETAFTREILVNWTPSLELNGSPIFVKTNVTDGTRYLFRVKAVNLADLEGEPMASDGVTIDTTKIPPACFDGEISSGESDFDCGGSCAGCAIGRHCNANTDCDSLFCLNGTCEAPACDDRICNGRETDVDCGGAVCAKCALEKSCTEDADCESNKCKGAKCVIPDVCENEVLDGTESDIDCGGSCPNRCFEGQNCNTNDDCSPELGCYDNTCGIPKDLDADNVPDNIDKCPATPVGESVDELGCAPSQSFSCGDEIDDAWRIKYFGSALCVEEGALTADIDKDQLTNVEEYRAGTNPTARDTDRDGWSDSEELQKGTNPLDKKSHPTSVFFTIIKILFLLVLLGGGGYSIYYGYKRGYFQRVVEELKKRFKKEAAPELVTPEVKPKPAVLPARPPPLEKIAQLRKFVKKKEAAPEEFVPLEEIKKQIEGPRTIEKLRELKKKPKLVEMRPKAGAIARLKGIKEQPTEDAISRLKKLKKAK